MARRRFIALLLGMTALVAVIGGGVALGTSMSAQPEPPPAPKAATVSSQLLAHFAALNTGAGADSAGIASASSETQSHLESSAEGLSAQFGLNPSLARRVAYGDAHLWVEPGSAGLCLMDYEAEAGVAVARSPRPSKAASQSALPPPRQHRRRCLWPCP